MFIKTRKNTIGVPCFQRWGKLPSSQQPTTQVFERGNPVSRLRLPRHEIAPIIVLIGTGLNKNCVDERGDLKLLLLRRAAKQGYYDPLHRIDWGGNTTMMIVGVVRRCLGWLGCGEIADLQRN